MPRAGALDVGNSAAVDVGASGTCGASVIGCVAVGCLSGTSLVVQWDVYFLNV